MSNSKSTGKGKKKSEARSACTHMAMTRVYGEGLACDSCGKPGQFGWVYRCTQDREDLIEFEATKGLTVSFDSLGEELSNNLVERRGSPAARFETLSLLDEMKPTEMQQYSPEQLARLLRQREEVQLDIDETQAADTIRRFGFGFLRGRDPWVCTVVTECKYKVCPACRPTMVDRSWLSLNAVAEGELLPTAATGFGFHTLGARPLVDAEVIKNIGSKDDPPARPNRPGHSHKCSSVVTDQEIMEMLDYQIACGYELWKNREDEREDEMVTARVTATAEDFDALEALVPKSPGRLRNSPSYEALAGDIDALSLRPTKPPKSKAAAAMAASPWTPPPSPRKKWDDGPRGNELNKEAENGSGDSTTSSAAEPFYYGRRVAALRSYCEAESRASTDDTV